MKPVTKTKECPKCGTQVEFKFELSSIMEEGIEDGIKNRKQEDLTNQLKIAVNDSLKENNVIWQKKLDKQEESFKNQRDEDRKKHAEERKKDADRNNKLNERIEKLSAGIIETTKPKSYDDGRIQEENIEEILKKRYMRLGDKIDPVPDGVKGSDVIHTIFDKQIEIGPIVVESKNTKKYMKKFEDKLLLDMNNAKAEFGILVTKSMPGKPQDPVIRKYNGKIIIVKKDAIYSYFKLIQDFYRDIVINKFKNKLITTKDLNKEAQIVIDKINGTEFANTYVSFSKFLKDLLDEVIADNKSRKRHYETKRKLLRNLLQNLYKQINIFKTLPLITSKQLKEIEVEADVIDDIL